VTLLRLARLSDAYSPARELLEVADDGTFTGWRSQGPLVGACRGTVAGIDALRALVERAGTVPPRRGGDLPLDATVDLLAVGDHELRAAASTTPDGAWGDLLRAARAVLEDEVPRSPHAAIELVIGGPPGLRLVHRGEAPIVLELGAGWAEVTRWRDGVPAGSAETRDLAAGRVEAGPGWSIDIALVVPAGEPGDLVTASAWFVAEDEGVLVPVVLTGRATSG
jgi:hypothetical protein